MATFADQLTEKMETHGQLLYHVLHLKYEGFAWAEKYVSFNRAYLVSELTGLLCCLEGLDFFWTYKADINLIVKFVITGLPIVSLIHLEDGTNHTVCIVGVNESREILYVHDPLGDYHSNYQNHNGAYTPFPYGLFQKIAVGNPLCLACCSPPKKRAVCSNLLKNVQHFRFTTEEVQDAIRMIIKRDG